MALTERLALLISLDAQGAVKGLEKVGKAADRNLGRTESRIDRTSQGFQKAGAGMMAAGGLVIGGLFKLAKMSEEAAGSTRRLENSIRNNAKLAGHSADEFIDLADAISKKTAADNDDIVAGQAVLAQFKLEADQIKTLTPLVVDLARKKGIDLAAAATLAAKAVDGNSGALKRQGIIVDEAAFKADSYTATVEGLRDSVGGFAEEEGQTFAGSLERAKNQLGDLAEGVGAGAVDAFTDLLDPMTKAAAKFKEMDPAAQSLIGKMATFGAVGLTAAGGLTFTIGKLIQMRDTLAPLGGRLRTAEGGLTRLGGAAAAVPFVGLAIGIAQMGREMDGLKISVNNAVGAFSNMDAATEEQTRQMLTVVAAAGGLEDLLGDVAEQSVPAAQRLLEFADANGFAEGKVDELRDVIEDKREADVQGAEDQAAYSEEVIAATESTDGLAESTGGLTDKLKEQEEALRRVLDATIAQFDANIGYRRSIDDTEEALAQVLWLTNAGKTGTEEYRDAVLDAESALLDQADAAVRLYEDTAAANGQTLTAEERTNVYRDALAKLRDSLKPGSPLRKALDGYIASLDNIPTEITTVVNLKRPTRNPDEFDGSRASGGPVTAGSTYLVGEHGPEVLSMGSQSGYVYPNPRAVSGGTTLDQTVIINNPVPEPISKSARHLRRVALEAGA